MNTVDMTDTARNVNVDFHLGNKCPNCQSTAIGRDSPTTWLFLFAFLLFPFSLLLLLLNSNRYCRRCGTRFKKLV